MESKDKITSHSGQFLCVEIGHEVNQKLVSFRHLGTEPDGAFIPDVPGLRAFYATFSSLLLFNEPESDESAFYIATPNQWQQLDEIFEPWIADVAEDEIEEYLPSWIDSRLVIGEIPASGNFLMVPTIGDDAGKVFEFEHDGFEFIERGWNLLDFVEKALNPDSSTLTAMASHLRFMTEESSTQWWIKELRDNRGRIVSTEP
jgi:hypothetical protein